MSTKRSRMNDSMDFPDQTDIRNLTTSITLNSSNADNKDTVVVATESEYTFTLPASFSVYRNRPCNIKVTSASVTYSTAAYASVALGIDIATNIPAQGQCYNFPHPTNSQVVQASLQVPDPQKTEGVANGYQQFSATSPASTTFRCQALPDKITLFMLRTRLAIPPPIEKRVPNHATMTLQIDFDEPI